jgi:hypothetical protein
LLQKDRKERIALIAKAASAVLLLIRSKERYENNFQKALLIYVIAKIVSQICLCL